MTEIDINRFTLVVPTYERPEMLKALLTYLAARNFPYPVLILDSSSEAVRAQNITNARATGLKLGYGAYDPATKPFEKFRDGLSRLGSTYCALCADDDLILPDAVMRTLDFLDANPDHGMAHGHYFTFLPNGDGQGSLDLLDVLYDSPSIDQADPLGRLSTLFQRYQATTYGIYRTKLLQGVFQVTTPVESLLARELLASALTVCAGKVGRMPFFTHGRSMAPSHHYAHWHPLEWLMRDAPGLMSEYAKYRAILLANLPDNFTGRTAAETAQLVDTIHAFYLVRHVPLAAQGFILDKMLNRMPIDHFWPDHAIQIPLLKMSQVEEHADPVPALPPAAAPAPEPVVVASAPEPQDEPAERGGFFSRLFGGGGKSSPRPAAPAVEPALSAPVAPVVEEVWPRTIKSENRSYRIHTGFARARVRLGEAVPTDRSDALLLALDSYRL